MATFDDGSTEEFVGKSIETILEEIKRRNMNLEQIGFYTLSDKRARTASETSSLQRCELILTSRCNFKCQYCRGMKKVDQVDLTSHEAFSVVEKWTDHHLRNIRFSGGEPTLWKDLPELVKYAKARGVVNIALSTNGSASTEYYLELLEAGVNDFSISLDSCCSSTGNKMAGRDNVFDTIVNNIKVLSMLTYVTVGVVLTDENYQELNNIVTFASDLGVADIRVIPAAQVSKELENLSVDQKILAKHPILKYRYNNFLSGKSVRGISDTDTNRCPLVLDDMAVMNMKHYPCIIYMREHGAEIGTVDGSIKEIRRQRAEWYAKHDCSLDRICKNNCLDVCVDYNNKVLELQS